MATSNINKILELGEGQYIEFKESIDKSLQKEMVAFANAYLKERVPVRYEINDAKRKEFPEYPVEAYREAIVNAIIHFDYFLGDTIAIEKLRDKIIINNKGELLFLKKILVIEAK